MQGLPGKFPPFPPSLASLRKTISIRKNKPIFPLAAVFFRRLKRLEKHYFGRTEKWDKNVGMPWTNLLVEAKSTPSTRSRRGQISNKLTALWFGQWPAMSLGEKYPKSR